MKRKILLGSFLLMAAALISIGSTPSATGQANTGKAIGERLITVLNPAISTKFVERVPLAPRLDTLEGKTIYLVDLQWGGPEAAYSVYEEMQGWFSRNMPSVKVVDTKIQAADRSAMMPGFGRRLSTKRLTG